jgi:hypothetical protein
MVNRFSPYNQFKIFADHNEWVGLDNEAELIDLNLPHDAAICATGLTLPKDLDQKEWEKVGEKLGTIHTGIQWAIGDWWCYGHHTYGKRAEVAAKKILPYEFGTLMNMGMVARKVAPSLRNEALGFAHHQAVAKLEPDDQKKWLAKAVRFKLSVKKLQDQILEATSHERMRLALGCDPHWTDDFFKQASEAKHVRDAAIWKNDGFVDLDDVAVDNLILAATEVVKTWTKIQAGLERSKQDRVKSESKPSKSAPKRIRTDQHMQQAAE